MARVNWKASGSGAMKGAAWGSVVPGVGTAVGAGAGFVWGLFQKPKPEDELEDYVKAAHDGGYVTVPPGGIPGHPEWKAGTRQWIPPGSPVPDISVFKGQATANTGGGTMGGGMAGGPALQSGIDYDAIRERAIAPSRAVYANAMRNLNRQKAMAGGYAPGYGAQLAQLSRGQSQAVENAAIGAEAGIANTKLQQLGLQQEAALRGRELDIRAMSAPSKLDKNLDTTNKVLDTISTGAKIYADYRGGGM